MQLITYLNLHYLPYLYTNILCMQLNPIQQIQQWADRRLREEKGKKFRLKSSVYHKWQKIGNLVDIQDSSLRCMVREWTMRSVVRECSLTGWTTSLTTTQPPGGRGVSMSSSMTVNLIKWPLNSWTMLSTWSRYFLSLCRFVVIQFISFCQCYSVNASCDYLCIFICANEGRELSSLRSIGVYTLLLIANATMISLDARITEIATNLGWFNSFLVASLSPGEK